jgi:hypothetical protein
MKTRNCPFCAEEIKLAAIKCKHCSEFLNREEIVSSIVKIWMCEDCNEEIEDNFDACWNCSSEKRTDIIEKIDTERLLKKLEKKEGNINYVSEINKKKSEKENAGGKAFEFVLDLLGL